MSQKYIDLKSIINRHVLFLARSICHPEEFTFLHLGFLGATSILFLSHLVRLLDVRSFGSKFPLQGAWTGATLLLLSEDFLLSLLSPSYRKLQSNWFFLSAVTVADIIPNHFHWTVIINFQQPVLFLTWIWHSSGLTTLIFHIH